MSILSYSSNVSETFKSASVKEGRGFRSFYEKVLTDLDPKVYIEVDLNTVDIILHHRILSSNSGPVTYRVRTDYSLDTSPYLSTVPSYNLNQIKKPIRVSQIISQEVDPAKVISAGTIIDVDKVVATETAGNRSVGAESFQDIYRALEKGSKFLLEIEKKAGVPDADVLLILIWEESVSL